MKHLFYLIAAVLFGQSAMYAQVWSEDFETDGNNVRYFAVGQFNDIAGSGNDHYGRTEMASISNVSGAYSGQSGTWFFAGEDINDTGDANADGLSPKTLLFAPVDVTGVSQIELRALIASGNVGGGWDNTDTFYFEYNLDGGGWIKIMQFAAPVASTNVGMNFDADLNGLGEGAQINTVFTQYSASIPGTGTSLEIRVVTGADSASEEFAFDLVSIWEVGGGPVLGCTNPDADNYDPAATVDDGSCIISGCTDPLALNYDVDANNNDGSCIYGLPAIVINEIHYNPCTLQGDDTVYEFLELHNAGASAVDLSGWTISNAVNFTFPNGSSIAAGEYIIVCVNATAYTGNGYQVFQWNAGSSLNNTGETITLSTPDPLIVDEAAYSDSAPWPTSADGGCPSLELIDPSLDNSDPLNWQASYVSNGTPGAQNSTPPPPVSYTVVECQTIAIAGDYVSTDGIVTAVYPAANLFTIQDGQGAYSGIWVSGNGVTLGDEVNVVGVLSENFDLTLITADVVTINSFGNPLPTTEVLGTLAVNDEQWEGVLVETTGEVAIADAGFGEWSVDDLSGQVFVDDLAYLFAPAPLFTTFTVIGPLYYSFGQYKIEPRDANDVLRWGCTDNNFPNYDPLAVIDDGTCGIVPGCTDPLADNFDPAATIDDGSCIYIGCTDPLALNYELQNNQDDGSCYFTLPNLVVNEIHYNPCTAQGDDFDWEFIEIFNNDVAVVDLSGYTVGNQITFEFPLGSSIAPGEYIIVAINALSYVGNGYQVFEAAAGNLTNSPNPLDPDNVEIFDAFGNLVDVVSYDDVAPWPITPDGGCPSLELIDPSLDNSDPNNWQASYVANGTPGAQNSTPPPATPYTIVELQTVAVAGEYVSTTGIVTAVYAASNLHTIQNGLGAYTGIWVEGNTVAIGDDVSVEGFLTESFGLTILTNSVITVNSSNNALPEPLVLGTLPANLEAWEGVLIRVTAPVFNGNLGFGEWSVSDGTGPIAIDDLGIIIAPAPAGVTFTVTGPLYYSFSAFKMEPRDAADVQEWGCTDALACNYSATAVIEDYSCDYSCVGCTDMNAANYNALATIDDGSCLFPGCTYPDASNYDINANVEDGSCVFVNPCPYDINGDSIVNTADLLDLLSAFGSTCP